MRVIKRNNELENVSFDKILNRLNNLCNLPDYKKLNCDVSIGHIISANKSNDSTRYLVI